MPEPATEFDVLTVALIGNPNTGKSTLFNALSGMSARTGNYPGVTVEKKVGRMQIGGRRIDLVDLPGTYSLAPRSPDEMVSVNVLLGRQADVARPQVVVCIADASNLERNLYLFSQVIDLGLPTVLVLNMVDVASRRRVTIDAASLEQRLGVPVVPTEAHRGVGIEGLKARIVAVASNGAPGSRPLFPPPFLSECQRLREQLAAWGQPQVPDYLLERMLLDVGGFLESHGPAGAGRQLATWLAEARQRLAAQGCSIPAIEARVRYQWARDMLSGVVTRPAALPKTAGERVDRLLTHRVSGFVFFAAVMFLAFQALYRWATPLMELFESAQGVAADGVTGLLPAGPFRSLLIDGVVAGVGAVLVFIPQIAFLFMFIAILEDCGYMARAAFLMDKLMTKVGLSGKSFVPLMSSFACAVPGVMATRVIEDRRDRMTTMLVAPLMSCSARQPVYALLIASFIPATHYLGGWVGLQGLVLFGATSLGAVVAVPMAWLFKKTLFRGEPPPFVMELPGYKWPSWRTVLSRVYHSSRAFVVRAGTLIFATNILVWAAGYFPGDHSQVDAMEPVIAEYETNLQAQIARAKNLQDELQTLDAAQGVAKQAQRAGLQSELATLEIELASWRKLVELRNVMRAELLEQSLLGRLGRAIEPAVKPLGWDWRIGVGVMASFPAREVIIGTLGTIYSLGGSDDPDDTGLQAAIRSATWPDGRPVYNVPVALSIMVFFALCAQCASTLMVIKREANRWWPALLTFLYMTALAYAGALAAYRAGMTFLE